MASHSVIHSPKFSILSEEKTKTEPQPQTIAVADVIELLEEVAADARASLQRSILEGRWNHAYGSLALVCAMEELSSRIAGGC